MKIIVAGSRTITNYDIIKRCLLHAIAFLNQHFENSIEPIEIVSGGARGVDRLGELFAKEYNLKLKYFLADWDTHGKMAGFIRNKQMAAYADCLIAFRIAKGKSSGTDDMIKQAIQKNLIVMEYHVSAGTDVKHVQTRWPAASKTLFEE